MLRDRAGPIVTPLLLAGLCSYPLAALRFPVAWLIGPLLVGIGYALARGRPAPLPGGFMTLAKALIGAAAATRFSLHQLQAAATYAAPLLTAIAITGGLSLVNGYLISRWSGLTLATGVLGAIPGTASATVAISGEMGADPAAVAVLQYLRLVMVVLVVPVAAGLLAPDKGATPSLAALGDPLSQGASSWSSLAGLGLCCAGGIWIGRRWRLPTGALLGTLLCALALLGLFPGGLSVPRPLIDLALLSIGLSAGLRLDWPCLRALKRAVILEVLLVLVLMLCCLGIGYGFHCLTQVDMGTALLAFAPGGMEAMIATSNRLGGDTGLVLTIMLIRQVLIITAVNTSRLYLNPTQRAGP